MSRMSHLFRNTTVANACPTGTPASSGAGASPKPPTAGASSSGDGAENNPVTEALLNPRENIRELIQELIKEAEENPACEGVRRRLNNAEATNASTIIHTIGTYLPVPVHDFLKDLVDRLHKLTRRAEDACAQNLPSAANASGEPAGLSRVCPTTAPSAGGGAAPAPAPEAPAAAPAAAAAAATPSPGPADEAAAN